MFKATIVKDNVIFLGVAATQFEAEGMALQSLISNTNEGDAYTYLTSETTSEDCDPFVIIDGDRLNDDEYFKQLETFINSVTWNLE